MGLVQCKLAINFFCSRCSIGELSLTEKCIEARQRLGRRQVLLYLFARQPGVIDR